MTGTTTRSHTPGNRRSTARKASSRRPKRRSTKRATKGHKGRQILHRMQVGVQALLIRLALVLGAGLLCYLVYIYLVAPYTSRWQALYGTEVYPEGYSIRGIDISHHQGTIDWQKLSRATIGDEPVGFAFIKATEGGDHLDENFNDNFYQAREYGIIRGAYHYYKPGVSPVKQADYFLKQAHLEEGDLPPVLDIEERGDLTVEELRRDALKWLRRVEKHYGVPPIIYTNYKFKVEYLNTRDFERYPYWIAHYYVKTLTYKGPWKFWQHTDCGRLDGIREKVDLNIYNGSMYDLKRLCLE